MGRALSNWEGLQSSASFLFTAVTGSSDWKYSPIDEAFGLIDSALKRSELIKSASRAFFEHVRANTADSQVLSSVIDLESAVLKLVTEYQGWAPRRNELAHGVVVGSQHQDYDGGTGDLVVTYRLYPSMANSKKWHLISVEPSYGYRAAAIERFADGIKDTDRRMFDFALELGSWWNLVSASLKS